MCAYRLYIEQRDASYEQAEKWVEDEVKADKLKEAIERQKRAEDQEREESYRRSQRAEKSRKRDQKEREKVLLEMADKQNKTLAATSYQNGMEKEKLTRREVWRAEENLRWDRLQRERGLSKTPMEIESWKKIEASTRRAALRLVAADPHYCICGKLGFHSGYCPGAVPSK